MSLPDLRSHSQPTPSAPAQRAALNRLAVNVEGFAFDPQTGDSFLLNPVGLFVLDELRDGHEPDAVVIRLTEKFGIDSLTASRDVAEFVAQLRDLNLWEAAI